MMYKKKHNEKMSFRDFIALMKMSMRSWIWRHEGDSFIQNLRKSGATIAWGLAWYFVLGFAIGGFAELIRLIIVLFSSIFTKVSFFAVLKGILTLVVLELCIFDPKKVLENIKYTESAWWNNTGIHPVQVVEDAGTYGEYAATMLVDKQMRDKNMHGKIYNSLMIPMKNHEIDTFSEADIVAVNEKGIQVFEVKNQVGSFSGRYNGKTWFRNDDYTADPPYGNPMKQNQNHINYIIEYLYPKLNEAGLLDKNDPLLDVFVNIVIFTDNRYTSVNLDFSDMPSNTGFFFSGGQEDTLYDVDKINCSRGLTNQQIDFICGLFDKLSEMTLQQHQAMVAEKVWNDSQMEFSWEYRAVFKAAMCLYHGEGPFPYIARSNGNYTWFDPEDENNFWAFPELQITHSVETGSGDEGYSRAKETVEQWKVSLGQ